MTRGLKIGLIVLAVAAVGTGGFLTFNYFQKKKAAKGSPGSAPSGGSGAPSGGSGSGSGAGSGAGAGAASTIVSSIKSIFTHGGGGAIAGGASSGSGSYNAAAFPLKKGSNGPEVGQLQSFLGKTNCSAKLKDNGVSVPVADNAFGPITEAALKACYGVTQVNESLYKQMLASM